MRWLNSATQVVLKLPIFLVLFGCGSIDYSRVVETSKFDGRLFVMWVGEGSAYSGDGRFVFIPNPNDPLTFTRLDNLGNVIGQPIRPEIMYTDGGSIPRLATVFKGLSPWGYAPAYMVHDWLFIAHHCNVDGTPTEEEKRMSDLNFSDSAIIMAEAIKSLQVSGQVQNNDVSGFAVSSAVSGPISRSLWNRKGACEGHRVSKEHKAAALEAFPRSIAAVPEDVGLEPLDLLTEDFDADSDKAILIGEFGF
ncbi:hypothetical protein [Ruegeria sp.]|uniref:hypothetical protein n=1 Tax=Ruegeria sp. TaxID=1879320 RepID=UPI003C7E8A25